MVSACKTWEFDSIPTSEITSVSSFSDWYETKANVNVEFSGVLPLTSGSYDSAAFFPIDDEGFGNSGRAHNFHFTMEAHVTFSYQTGQVITVASADDL